MLNTENKKRTEKIDWLLEVAETYDITIEQVDNSFVVMAVEGLDRSKSIRDNNVIDYLCFGSYGECYDFIKYIDRLVEDYRGF